MQKNPEFRYKTIAGRFRSPVVSEFYLPDDVERQTRLSIDPEDLEHRSSDELAWLIRECLANDLRAAQDDNAMAILRQVLIEQAARDSVTEEMISRLGDVRAQDEVSQFWLKQYSLDVSDLQHRWPRDLAAVVNRFIAESNVSAEWVTSKLQQLNFAESAIRKAIRSTIGDEEVINKKARIEK